MWGYLGLTTAYILIASILLWLFISSRAYLVVKLLVVPVVLWYGIVLYYTPTNLMGWPTSISSAEELPSDAFVLGAQIKEPSKKTDDPGGIFLTILKLDNGTDEIGFSLDPKAAFSYKGKSEPRIYKIPYSKELHKKILEAQERQKGERGSTIKTKKKGKKGDKEGTIGDETSKAKEMFRIINPINLMPKDGQE